MPEFESTPSLSTYQPEPGLIYYVDWTLGVASVAIWLGYTWQWELSRVF